MIAYLINWLIWNILQSIVFTSLALGAIYWFYIKKIPRTPLTNQPQYEEFKLEDTFIGMIDRNQDTQDMDLNSMNVLNLILQFFFQELKDTKTVRRYFIRRLSLDFEELLTTKAAGKFIERLSTRDFSLGTSFPVVNSVKVESYKLDSTKKLIDEVSVIVDFEYKNGFSISVDADLIFGKSAFVHIKVVLIKGKIRLQFTRQPFTHWSFAFIEVSHSCVFSTWLGTDLDMVVG
ncbi:PDZ domain-containing 8 [Brachionus plicatilis]|uniref:PDZ domain-containing 8 n=1 Tax=Brachionus plicatilis TaxID=10195 RepID=A0A3M7R2D4_BRAPC|nr:PDZ domain-containing 8 [Brachionus plicatilis]